MMCSIHLSAPAVQQVMGARHTLARLRGTRCRRTYGMSLILNFSKNNSRHTSLVWFSVFSDNTDNSVMHL